MVRRHLDLPQLKALAARLVIAQALQSQRLVATDEKTHETRIKILKQMVAAADLPPAGRLDQALKALSNKAREQVIEGEGAAFDALRDEMSRMADDLARIDCQVCAKSEARICRGEPAHDEPIISTRGQCIAPLHTLLQFITRRTRRVYREATRRFPKVTLSTKHTHEAAVEGLLKDFNVSGRCEILNDPMLSAVVELTIKEQRFDWNALCEVPYLLTHEVVCHAFQDLHPGQRAGADEKCPWSEGWMDRLAFRLAEHWTTGSTTARFPSWLLVDHINVAEQTNAIHGLRYKSRGSMTEYQASVLGDARRTFDELAERWGGAFMEQHMVAKFSARLNACTVPNEIREDIVQVLWTLLLGRDAGVKAEQATGYCAEFAQAHDDRPASQPAPAPPAHQPEVTGLAAPVLQEPSAASLAGNPAELLKRLKELENTPMDVLLRQAREE